MKFSYVNKPDALAGLEIMSLLKDRDGNLWMGTLSGLHRFDGRNDFSVSKATKGLTNSTVLDLCQDTAGNIWGATAAGIFRFEPSRQKFSNYSTLNVGLGPGVENILCTTGGDIFAAGIPGILKYDAASDSFLSIGAGKTKGFGITQDRVRKNGLIEDPSGKGLWIATAMGLNYYDLASGTFLNHNNQTDPFLLNDHHTRALATSPRGYLWVFDQAENKVIGFKPGIRQPLFSISLPAQYAGLLVASIFEDKQQRIWLSTLSSGILLISDWESGHPVITPISHSAANPNTIRSSFFWDALEDADGTIWLGTLAGIAKVNSSRDFYKVHPVSELVPELKLEYAVAWITERKTDSSFWIGMLKDEVVQYKPGTGQVHRYDLRKALRNQKGELPGRVNEVAFIDDLPVVNCYNGTWVLRNNTIEPFTSVPAPYTHLPYIGMVQAPDGSFWLTDTKSLVHWNRVSAKAERYTLSKADLAAIPNAAINRLKLAPDGVLWMSLTSGNLAYFDAKQQVIKAVPLTLPEAALKTSYFYTFDIDRAGNIWMPCSGWGLVKMEAGSRRLSWWDDSAGIRNSIESTITDKFGHVWSFIRNKVMVLLPSTNNVYRYELPYGNNNFSYTVFSSRLQNGNLIANIGGDIVELLPDRIAGNPQHPRVNISEVYIGDKPQQLFGDTILRLLPEENFLTFRFGSLTDQMLFPYNLQYKMDGVDVAWKNAGDDGVAVYTQLPPGDYVFRVAAVGKSGQWQTAEQRIRVHVSTPFYLSAWFRALLLLLIGGLLYYWYSERMAQQQKLFATESKAQLLAKEKTQVQYENLKQHLNPHFLFNSLTTLSSLIEINPKMAGTFLRSLSKTYRYILQSKDKETVTLGDELTFVQTFIALQQTRFDQGLQVINNVPPASLNRHIVPVTLQNLVENAIKHNVIDDENVLRITMDVEDDYLVVANKMQLKKFVETSNKQGLDNLQSLYTYLTDKPLTYESVGDYFIVKIPLL